MTDFAEQARELLMYCKLLYHRGYIAGTQGNLSIRLSQKRFMVTPRGFNKGLINSEDMVICDRDGNKLEGSREPSSEIKIHAAVYRKRDDVNAICHTHPTFATTFALTGRSFDKAILPEFVASLGVVPLVGYATPGSEKLVLNLLEVIEKHDAFLLEKHGSLTLGESMTEAYNRTEMLEQYSKLLFYTKMIESPGLLSREETERLLNMGRRPEIKGIITTEEDEG